MLIRRTESIFVIRIKSKITFSGSIDCNMKRVTWWFLFIPVYWNETILNINI